MSVVKVLVTCKRDRSRGDGRLLGTALSQTSSISALHAPPKGWRLLVQMGLACKSVIFIRKKAAYLSCIFNLFLCWGGFLGVGWVVLGGRTSTLLPTPLHHFLFFYFFFPSLSVMLSLSSLLRLSQYQNFELKSNTRFIAAAQQ